MKKLALLSILVFAVSCHNNTTKTVEKSDLPKETEVLSENETQSDSIVTKDSKNEVMKEEDLLFNGKLKRYFSLKEFENVLGKTDSIKLMSEEEPCSYIFENEDGSKDMEDKYLYKDGSRFENTKDKVAVDEFRFTKNNFILFKGNKLNANTTTSDLQKLFPNAIKNIGTMNVYGEGDLQVIQLREDDDNISDGHIKVFIKNGKLYYMHWWFPC
ncbi:MULTISPECIES: hypothetical protein [Flavobacterium]|uniref:hypothetical protein n=1 Tax=Flavobacterium TaxID=237 RepID=UPI00118396E2|nr:MULTISPECIES: hypothetical protein [Flavobacterium]MCR4030437.1 hypothetical protein [Flavobacterium panacis]